MLRAVERRNEFRASGSKRGGGVNDAKDAAGKSRETSLSSA